MNVGKAIGLTLMVVVLLAFWQIRWLLLMLFTAIVLAMALNMLADFLQRWRLKRIYALLVAVLIFFVGLGGFVSAIVPPLFEQFQELSELLPQTTVELGLRLRQLGSQFDPKYIQFLPDLTQFFSQLQPLFNEVLGGGLKFFYGSLGSALSLLLLLALTLMLALNPRPYRQGFIRFFPLFYRKRIDSIIQSCEISLQGWLAGIVYNMVAVTLLCWVGLMILGIPLAFGQAAIAGLLTFIPSLGLMLSAIPPLAIALLEEPWKPIGVICLYLTIQQIDNHFLTPRISTPSVYLLPAITLLSQLVLALAFGFLGLFIALPLTIIAHIGFREIVVKDILNQWTPTE